MLTGRRAQSIGWGLDDQISTASPLGKRARTWARLNLGRLQGGYGHAALHDTPHGARLEGWVWDPEAFPPVVVVKSNGQTLTEFYAIERRDDLLAFGIPDSARSFSIPLQELAVPLDATALSLMLRTRGGKLVALSGSPLAVDQSSLKQLHESGLRLQPVRLELDPLPPPMRGQAVSLRAHACDRAAVLLQQLAWAAGTTVPMPALVRKIGAAAADAASDHRAVVAVFDEVETAFLRLPGLDDTSCLERPAPDRASVSAHDRLELETAAVRTAISALRIAAP